MGVNPFKFPHGLLMSGRKVYSVRTSAAPFEFDLYHSTGDKEEFKSAEDDEKKALRPGKFLKKSLSTVGGLAKVPTKVLKGSPTTTPESTPLLAPRPFNITIPNNINNNSYNNNNNNNANSKDRDSIHPNFHPRHAFPVSDRNS